MADAISGGLEAEVVRAQTHADKAAMRQQGVQIKYKANDSKKHRKSTDLVTALLTASSRHFCRLSLASFSVFSSSSIASRFFSIDLSSRSLLPFLSSYCCSSASPFHFLLFTMRPARPVACRSFPCNRSDPLLLIFSPNFCGFYWLDTPILLVFFVSPRSFPIIPHPPLRACLFWVPPVAARLLAPSYWFLLLVPRHLLASLPPSLKSLSRSFLSSCRFGC